MNNISIGVIGLGYVGLPLIIELAKKHESVLGFDVSQDRVSSLSQGIDKNDDIEAQDVKNCSATFTSDEGALKNCNFIIVAVPTPIDEHNRPDLLPLRSASETVGRVISKGTIVVFESTVYPGLTEDYCGPIIEEVSGLKRGADFKLGYSPERVNPGDREHTIEKIVKVVSAEDAESLQVVSEVYGSVIEAGVHEASSIRVAEAAKVIENTQRDLNIALMNELALIFDRMGIPTTEVIEAAGTKWNFLKFKPGLVGGHCIGVDPYYLTTKAQMLGYNPQVILAGRSINDGMGAFVAQKTVKNLIHQGVAVRGARVGVLGVTFKENVSDLRNSKVVDIVTELTDFGVDCLVHDPLASAKEARHEMGVQLSDLSEIKNLDALILAVTHDEYLSLGFSELISRIKHPEQGVFIDVKSVYIKEKAPDGLVYWSL